MRTVFLGSPNFAVPILEALADSPAFEVVLVGTQGAKGPSPVENAANRRGLPVYRPATLRDAVSREPLVAAKADLFVVAAFGLILRQRTLDIPRLGAVNIHPSLLPKYRGASPIPATILSGDQETGVSLMIMDAGIDTGAVISVERAVVADDDTTESLGQRLAGIAASQAVRDIPRWAKGALRAIPQATHGASLTRTLAKADGLIDWHLPAEVIERRVRAMWPWPRAWTTTDGTLLQVHRATVVADDQANQAPGQVMASRKRIVVACGVGALELETIEPAGRKTMSAQAYLNGRRTPLERLGETVGVRRQPPLVTPIADASGG